MIWDDMGKLQSFTNPKTAHKSSIGMIWEPWMASPGAVKGQRAERTFPIPDGHLIIIIICSIDEYP